MYSLTLTNTCGINTDHLLVSKGVCKLYVPTAFTPNNDGKNDFFKASFTENVTSFKMQIFNRGGQCIFVSTNKYSGWDGKFLKVPQPIGVYPWIISYKTLSSTEEVIIKGVVTIIY